MVFSYYASFYSNSIGIENKRISEPLMNVSAQLLPIGDMAK